MEENDLSDLHTIEIGDLATAMLITRFMKKRFVVLKPLSELCRYDLVIDRGNGFERVQCKSGAYRNGCVIFSTSSSHYHRNASCTRSYRGDCDLFGVYCRHFETCYLVDVDIVGEKKGYLRVDTVRSNQIKKIRFADDYLI